MAQSNNFRVIINLSSYFSDHRHRARIFINDNIQTVKNLQDKVSHIFGINNFHLTSQNEFLPPSEDIRLLQNDEVLWATPTKLDKTPEQFQPEVETKIRRESKRKLNSPCNVLISQEPKKRKKSPVPDENLEENMIGEPSPESLKNKKKKKKKKDRRRSLDDSIIMNTSDVILMAKADEPETGTNPDACEETSPTISFGRSRDVPLSYKKNRAVPLITDEYLKQKKVNIVKIDFLAGNPAMLKENRLKDNEKEGNEYMDVDLETKLQQGEIPAKSVKEHSVGDDKSTEAASSCSEEKTVTSKGDLNVDLCNSKESSCEKVIQPVSLGEFETGSLRNLPKSKFFKTPQWRRQANHVNLSLNDNLVVDKISAAVPIESENSDKFVPEEKTEEAIDDIPDIENSYSERDMEQISRQSPTILQAEEACSNWKDKSGEIEEEPLLASFELSGISLDCSEAVGAEMAKTGNDSLGISGVQRIGRGSRSKSFKQITGVGALLGGLRASASITSLDSVCDTDTSEFVTRRVRKRSRKRQKKAHESVDEIEQVTDTYRPRPMNVSGSPAIHIKFSEDGQVDDITKVSGEAKGTGNVSVNGSRAILVESECDEVRVQEKDILSSPLMTNLLPKAGDVIAFKVMRLSDDYNPELSTYITAKVLSFNNSNNCVYFEILGGLDQCQNPEGKFSMDDSYTEAKSRYRRYVWTDLIEARLLFP